MLFKPKYHTTLLLFVIVLCSILVINACSLGQKKLTPLKVGINSWPGYTIAYYAKEAGLFEQRGLAVEFLPFENPQDAARAILRGSIEAAFVPLWDVMQADPANDTPAYVLVTNVSFGSDGIVTQPEIKSVQDLRGKRVGAKLGTVNHLILLEALKLHQLQLNDVKIEDFLNETATEKLQERSLAGAVIWEPLLSQTAQKINGNIVYTTKEVESLVIDGLMTRSSYVATNSQNLKQFILAWFDLMQAVETKPNEVFEEVGKKLGQTGESFARDYAGLKKGDISMNQRMFQPQGRLQEAIEQIVKLLKEDRRHGRMIRQDIEIHRDPVMAAIEEWTP